MNDIELTIIVPIYNQEKYLDECLKTIGNQAYQAYEVLLIDDGSTDATKEICLRYCSRNAHFKYLYQENKGLGPARNAGLDIANGNYIMFVDSDDAIMENSLEKIMSYARENGFDLLYYDELVCDSNLSNGYVSATLPVMDICVDKAVAFRNCFNPAHICARVYRRELFSNIRFKKLWYEDMEIFPSLLNHAKNIGYYKIPIYFYRQHMETITHNDFDNRNLNVITAWENAKEAIGTDNMYSEIFDTALRLSVYEFIFFKPCFAKMYIEWYNQNLLKSGKLKKPTDIDIGLIRNCQLINQAKMCNLDHVVNMIEKLSESWADDFCLINNEYFEYDEKKRGIYISVTDGQLTVTGFCLEEKSSLAASFLKDIKQDNIISRQNEVKDHLFDKLLVKNAILEGYKIYIK